MRQIDISRLDLNLVRSLEVLLEERNVTRAARRLHLTQSSVSHALARLREQLADELFVRDGRGLALTPLAERLSRDLPASLAGLRRVLSTEASFDAATSERVFTLAAPDFSATLLPTLIGALHERAPKAALELVVMADELEHALQSGKVDLAIGSRRLQARDGFDSELLADQPWVVFARRGHPCVAHWSAEAWQRYAHVVIRRGQGGHNAVSAAVSGDGLRRRVGAYVPHFTLAAPLVAASDLLITAPKPVFAGAAARYDLVALEAPVAVEPVHAWLSGRRARRSDPALLLLREVVQLAFAEHERIARALPVVRLRRRARS